MSEEANSLPPPSSDIAEDLSVASSSSSFIPIDKLAVFDAIQVINENKEFNLSLLDYIEKTAPIGDVGNNYHIVSVFGSQSTGKSTLLNRLFNTNFDVMDETRRQQTTKGIWLAYSPAVSSNNDLKKNPENVFVMDVEGTDGRERGEDQEFERKAALFALATSEILIINIWETQIGLYQGANMGLLKTVFEVNLSLFGKAKLQSSEHKVLLLFVIRDHLGVTPKENLANTINTDLKKLWDDLSKPAELAELKFEQFFDVTFHTMAHKVLQEDKFSEDIKLLGDKFVDKLDKEYFFKDNYHHNIPVDGWTMYAENCWRQIDENKDLDLPTQQILVARFKCDEVLNTVYEDFLAKYNSRLFDKIPSSNKEEHQIDYEDVGHLMLDLKQDALENFALGASRYNPIVYEQKREQLDNKITTKLKELINIYATFLTHESLQEFKHTFTKKSDIKFITRCEQVVKQINTTFASKLGHLTLGNLVDITDYQNVLKKDLDELIAKQQVVELTNIINKATKKLGTSLNKLITFEVNDAKENTWDTILQGFKGMIDDFFSKYTEEDGSINFGLGIDKELTDKTVEKFKFKAWAKLHDLIKKILSKNTILTILKERFDEKFRYDDNGLPRLYSNEFELEQSFNGAKIHAVQVLPILTIAKLLDSTEILPEYDIFSKDLKLKYEGVEIESDDEDDEPNGFAHIITETEKAEVLSKFKREVDAKYIETKRSIVQHVSQIPYYIYLVILVLGWNEFMAIIRNPIFFTLALLLGAGLYVMYQLNLLRPAVIVIQRMTDEMLILGKAKLKEFLVDDHEFHGRNMQKISEEIEMDDLSKPVTDGESDL